MPPTMSSLKTAPLMIARILGFATALVLIGASAVPAASSAFAAADVILAVILAVGAVLPAGLAGPVLASAAAYALGVFSIGVVGRIVAGGQPDLAAVLTVAGALGILTSLVWRIRLNRARD